MSQRHPTPWAYDRAGGSYLRAYALEDANGKTILRGGEMATISFYSAEAKALTEAAGEMEHLLRILLDPERPPTSCERTRPCTCEIHEGRRLLARIDEAKADR